MRDFNDNHIPTQNAADRRSESAANMSVDQANPAAVYNDHAGNPVLDIFTGYGRCERHTGLDRIIAIRDAIDAYLSASIANLPNSYMPNGEALRRKPVAQIISSVLGDIDYYKRHELAYLIEARERAIRSALTEAAEAKLFDYQLHNQPDVAKASR